MISKYVVRVEWVSAEEGGRKDGGANISLSTQYYYCTTLLAYDPPTWSVKLQPIEKGNNRKFYLTFLFQSYPRIISLNDELPLYEGPNLVGQATIVDILEIDKED